MLKELIKAQNIKCQGCVKNVTQGLLAFPGVSSVIVDIPAGLVTVEGENFSREMVLQKLAELGYPENSAD